MGLFTNYKKKSEEELEKWNQYYDDYKIEAESLNKKNKEKNSGV